MRTIDGRRVHLETIRIANRHVTSEEAVTRFIEAMQPGNVDQPPIADIRTARQRQRASERAARELERRGI